MAEAALVSFGWLFEVQGLRDPEGDLSFGEIAHLFDLPEVDFFVLLN